MFGLVTDTCYLKKTNMKIFTATVLLMWKPPPLQLAFKKK